MTQKRSDRRVQRTRQLLQKTMLELILQKGYDEVTVQEITDKADLSRATFYLHYGDKKDLLVACIDTIIASISSQFEAFTPDQWAVWDEATLKKIFEIALDKANLYRVIISGQAGIEVSRRLHSLIASKTKQFLEDLITRLNLSPNLPVDFLCHYYAGAMLSMIYWWLESENRYTPEEMTQMFREVASKGIQHVLGDGAQVIENS